MITTSKRNIDYWLLVLVGSLLVLPVMEPALETYSYTITVVSPFQNEIKNIHLPKAPVMNKNQLESQSNTLFWEKAPSLAINDCGYAHVYDGKIYFVGETTVQEFDPVRGNWSVISDDRGESQFFRGGSGLIGDCVYIIHGWTGNILNMRYYNITSNSFGLFPAANFNHLDVAVTTLDDILYLSGGWVGGNPVPTRDFSAYNPQNLSWYSLAPMGTARNSHEMVAVGGYIYALGGSGVSTAEKYDPVTNSWETIEGNSGIYFEFGTTPFKDEGIIAGYPLNTKIYITEKDNWYSGPRVNYVESTWQELVGISANSFVTLEGEVYSIGGRDGPGNYYDYVWRAKAAVLPVLDNPSDFYYYVEEGQEQEIIWKVEDENPADYNVTENGQLVIRGEVENESIQISVQGLSVGKYHYRCTVVDQDNLVAEDLVIVTAIYNNPPTIDHPDDFTFREGTREQYLTWQSSDDDPATYSVSQNQQIIETGEWDGGEITIDLDYLNEGNYTITCEVVDQRENQIDDTVIVTVTAKTSLIFILFSFASILSLGCLISLGIFIARKKT
jgi:hypothetical protein